MKTMTAYLSIFVKYLIIVLATYSFSVDFLPLSQAYAVDSAFTTGGTNYVIYDAGTYKASTNPSLPEWTTDDDAGSAKQVLGTYDLNPNLVRSQLQAMCTAGQRKIALVLSFYSYDEAWNLTDHQKTLTWKNNYAGGPPTMYSLHAVPSDRLRSNLYNVITDITNVKTSKNTPCFNEIQFRFSPGGAAHPASWTSWNEARYQEDWNFIVNIRNIINTAIVNKHIAIYYDLGLEQGGITDGQNSQYITRLISDYNAQYRLNDTYGFSIAWAPGRFQHLIEAYDQAGNRPAQHAVDIYEESGQQIETQMRDLYDEMKQTHEQDKSVIIQETYFNDSNAFNKIIASKNQLGIKIRTIMQWQMTRNNLDYWNIGSNFSYFAPNPADFNGDHFVNIIDFVLFMNYWWTNNVAYADFNGDGKINAIDYTIFMNYWQESP